MIIARLPIKFTFFMEIFGRQAHILVRILQHLPCTKLGYETMVEYLRFEQTIEVGVREDDEERNGKGHSLFCKQFSKMKKLVFDFWRQLAKGGWIV